jgi:methionyl-tRNA formyltransferase
LRLGFAGTPQFAVAALQELGQSHQICAVFTQPDRPAGRGQPLQASPVKKYALEQGWIVQQPVSFKDPQALHLLRELRLDALVVVAYGLILPPAALECPRVGCINIHASLLPRWRGAAPIQRAILAGDETTGVTIMRMEAGLDTGPLLASRAIRIAPLDTAKTLGDRLSALGAELISGTVERLWRHQVHEIPQPLEGVTYAEKIDKTEAQIDWRQDAAQIWRQVRAFNPWPIAQTRFQGEQLRVWEAQLHESPRIAVRPTDCAPMDSGGANLPGTVLAATQEGIDVACGHGVLRILRLQLAGRKPLPAGEFLRGQRLSAARFANA